MSDGTTDTGRDDELLTIRDAAALLRVSAVSLRRWTDAGKLPCLRVGGRRERRFRRHDLMAFVGQPGGSAANPSSPRTRPPVVLEGLRIDYGSHLCSLYETDLGRIKLSVPFLAEGLRRGDACFLIAGLEVQGEILKALENTAGEARGARGPGRLILSTGAASGDEMYDFLNARFVTATQTGDRGLRVVGDMAWFLDQGMDIDELQRFEMRFDQYLAPAYPVVGLCQYDARRFSGVGMLTALKTHPDTFALPLPRFLAN
jgi:transcriptional repressor of dcmA and dcmR